MANGGTVLANADWAPSVRNAVAELSLYRAVDANSIQVLRMPLEVGGLKIMFNLEVPVTAASPGPILPTEPIELRWNNENDIAECSPLFFSGREDFPEDLPHLNPVPNGENSCFCLALAGNDAVFHIAGLSGLLRRLENWLIAAANEMLAFPEWHPEPTVSGDDDKCSIAFLDVAIFQELAADLGPGEFTTGICVALSPNVLVVSQKPISLSQTRDDGTLFGTSALARSINTNNERIPYQDDTLWYGPWVLLRTRSSSGKTLFRPSKQLKDIYDILELLDSRQHLVDALQALEAGEASGRRRNEHDKSTLILVAVERPTPMFSEILGFSKSECASRIEILGFQLIAGTHNSLENQDGSIIRCQLFSSLRPAHLATISNVRNATQTLLVGCGALGSMILDFLVRSGVQKIVVIDKDILQPHNLARHRATARDLVSSKTDWAIRHAASVYFPDHLDLDRKTSDIVEIEGINQDIRNISEEKFRETIDESGLLIDASADPIVRDHLSAEQALEGSRRIRVEMYNSGMLGVISHCPESSFVTFSDLYAWLCAQAIGLHPCEPVRNWLAKERRGDLSNNEVAIGIGCGSATTLLPGWIVNQHAAALMPIIEGVSESEEMEPEIGINVLDSSGLPHGFTWLPAPAFVRTDLIDGWNLLISQQCLDRLSSWRSFALPNETGGYLYGIWRERAKRMTIVAGTPAPPGSQGALHSLTLESAENCGVSNMIKRRTAGRLSIVGTWHSHPTNSTIPSDRDMLTIRNAAIENRGKGWPTLMIIISEARNFRPVFYP